MGNEKKLQNRVAIVTGASRGIGRSIALELAGEGANVCVNYNKNSGKADEVVSQIVSMGRTAIAVGADVSKKPEVEKMVSETVSRLGRVDILVNNAGIIHFGSLLENEDQFHEMMQVNLMGVMYCAKEVSKHMIPNKSGKIVNISSVAGIGIPETVSGGYAVTKDCGHHAHQETCSRTRAARNKRELCCSGLHRNRHGRCWKNRGRGSVVSKTSSRIDYDAQGRKARRSGESRLVFVL